MSKKGTILTVGDSIQGPTGFANDLAGVSWCLAKDYDVHILGLQTIQKQIVEIDVEGERRKVTQHPNYPKLNNRFDFGTRSLPILLDQLNPDILLTVNDIQMINHVPVTMCPPGININIVDLPSKTFKSEYALFEELKGQVTKFREKFPRDTKWIAYCPQDGDPPMPNWSGIYRMADQTVAMAKYGQWVFKEFFKMDVPYIWHGVNTKLFNKKNKPKELQNKFVIGNFNRNQPRKQPVRCMEAFAKFAKDKPDVLLHMQMDWNDEFGWPINYFAQQYGIQGKMISPRPIGMPRDEVAKTYSMWDINVTPTAGEGFGLTHIEGFACGLPSIATDYTTSKELIIDGKPGPRGTLVPAKDLYWQTLNVAAVRRSLIDINALADTYNKYYYNRDLVKEHGNNAMEWAKKNVSWGIIQKYWIELVGNVIAGNVCTSKDGQSPK